MFIFLALYFVQLIICYFIWRKVYIEIPYMVDGFLITMTLIPIAGYLVPLMAASSIGDGRFKKKALDFIFMIKKS